MLFVQILHLTCNLVVYYLFHKAVGRIKRLSFSHSFFDGDQRHVSVTGIIPLNSTLSVRQSDFLLTCGAYI